MRLVKSRPRYHCDYCSRVSTRDAMERHERICWKNPDRYCSNCNNKGYYGSVEYGMRVEPCYYCSQREKMP